MSEPEPSTVTVLGLGAMGAALARALLRAGHPTTVWNRTAGRSGALVAAGARPAAGAAEAIEASPTVVVCLSSYEAVRAVLDPLSAVLAGRVVVNLTSGTPEQARATAEWAAEAGAGYLDGAVMAVPQGVGGSGAVVLCAGPSEVFAARRPELGALGTPVHVGEDAGRAALHDLALLGVMWSALTGFLHGAALVGAEGVPAREFAPMAARWLSAVAGFLPRQAARIDEGVYPGDVSRLALNAAGLGHLVEASRARGLGVDVPAPIKALFDRAVAEGRGGEGVAALVELIRKPAG